MENIFFKKVQNMYMNKTKRNLIIASAVINLILISLNLAMSIILKVNPKILQEYSEYLYFVSYSSNIIYAVISFAIGLVGSILLLFAVRSKGKHFRTSQGLYIAGFVIIVVCGGWLSWILLFISMFIPDIIVMNTPKEVKKEEIMENRAYEEKKKKIEDLKRLRDSGMITEEEYKEKLFELL